MAFTLVQAGTNLYAVNPEGGASSALTLPTGVTLTDTRIPRFARFKNYVIVVNTPSRPISVDTKGTVRVLTPAPPGAAVTLSEGSAGTLTGAFAVKQTFVILDTDGNIVSESGYGPTSQYVSITAGDLRADNIGLSPDAVTTARLYRTTNNGAVFFKWIDTGSNLGVSIEDDLADAGLGIIAAGDLGSAPDLVLVASYAGRVWGVGRGDGDNVRYTQAGQMYAWSALNTVAVPPVGDDRFGVTALVPRRDSLGIGRRNQIVQVTGNQTANIKPTTVSQECGFLSQEAAVVYRDTVFFLWLDGVYRWGSDGLTCLSDLAGVRSWFATDDYFNRGMFSQAFAVFDVVSLTYRLFLCSAGSTITDRWIEYSVATGKFYGPHKTDAFTPSCALLVRGSNDQPYAMIGSREGHLSQDIQVRSDWDATPIDMVVEMCGHDGGNPDTEKYFGQLSVHTGVEPAGTLQVTTIVGDQDDEFENETVDKDLTVSQERLDRIGQGQSASVIFENRELAQDVTLYGYEIDPVLEIGRH